MIASGLTRRSLCASIESSVPSPRDRLRMPPGRPRWRVGRTPGELAENTCRNRRLLNEQGSHDAVPKVGRQASAPTEIAVSARSGSAATMQATSCSMRPGAYRSFTFRLPAHLPTAHIAVAVSRGCVSLFASNCSRTHARLQYLLRQRRAPAWWLQRPQAACSREDDAIGSASSQQLPSSRRQAAAARVPVAALIGARVRARICHDAREALRQRPLPRGRLLRGGGRVLARLLREEAGTGGSSAQRHTQWHTQRPRRDAGSGGWRAARPRRQQR